jgi:dTDP-glucose 4,6-dehydratase
MNKFFITGGAGFIGSHLVEKIFYAYPKSKIIVLDKLTYAADKKYLKNILQSKRIKFLKLNINNSDKYKIFLKKTDLAINVAAESHVDNSFKNSVNFTLTNTLGAHIFFQSCLENGVKNIIHVSTDEVYGDKRHGKSKENDYLNPTNPYSASKAAIEIILKSYSFFTKRKILIIRANNIVGARQYPEKLIPHCITSILKKKKITIHGSGQNQRCFLFIDDFVEAFLLLIKKNKKGIFNIGNHESYRNIYVANLICRLLNVNSKKNIKFVRDRPFNDSRYSIDYSKIKKLGWNPKYSLEEALKLIIPWYQKNYKKFKI